MHNGGNKRCLYEVLGVDRDSSPDDIRAAYKSLALQHHPDKATATGVPTETATARFQEILNAYQVLSHPNERASYDSHRGYLTSFFETTSPRFADDISSSNIPRPSCDVFDDDLFECFDPGEDFADEYADLFEKINKRERGRWEWGSERRGNRRRSGR